MVKACCCHRCSSSSARSGHILWGNGASPRTGPLASSILGPGRVRAPPEPGSTRQPGARGWGVRVGPRIPGEGGQGGEGLALRGSLKGHFPP